MKLRQPDPDSPKTKAKTNAARGPVDLTEFLTTSDSTVEEGDVLIHAPPKNGKTFLAASASEFYPADLSTLKKPAQLHDMLWLCFDKGATAGFQGAKLVVENQIDCLSIMARYRVPLALEKITALAKHVCDTNKNITTIVCDTVSQLDKYLVGYYAEVHVDNKNDFAVYQDVFARHKRFHADLTLLNKRMIWLCHSKVVMEASLKTPDQQNRKKASAVPGGEPIIPDITGQARTVYVGNASLELVVKCFVAPGKDKKNRRYVVYPYGGDNHEGSNRYHHVLDTEEPAHLGQIFAKIRKGK